MQARADGPSTKNGVPRIGRGFRLQWEPVQSAHVLLYPEGMVKLNASAGEILLRCDGATPVEAIVADLENAFRDQRSRTRRARVSRPRRGTALGGMDMSDSVEPADGSTTGIGPPHWLLAELTYRCPLHCVFCYNPVDFAKHEDELSTADWLRVLREARAIGAVQCGFSGGEPLQRNDLEILVAEAHKLGYYTNLITSGIGLNEQRIAWLKEAGLDHIQLSFQDSTREVNDFLSSTRTFDLKRKAAALIKQHGYAMVMNCVIHRLNIDHIDTHHRARRRTRRRLPRACQHAVLFVGTHQHRSTAADARAADPRRRSDEPLARKARLEDETLLRRAGLLRITTEEMHERLGQRVHDDRARRRRPALPHGAHAARPRVPERARAQPRARSGTSPKASTAIAAPAG